MNKNTVRIECTFEDLDETWIEVPDRGWTLAEMDAIANGRFPAAETVALVQRYVTACHLQVMDVPETEIAGPKPAGPVSNPADLTENILRYYMDVRFLNFLVAAIYEGAKSTFELAPLAVRVSSDRSGTKAKPAIPAS